MTATKPKRLRGGNSNATAPDAPQASTSTTPPTKTRAEIQMALDDLIFWKGTNCLNWPDADELLATAGLKRTDVTQTMLNTSISNASSRLRELSDRDRLRHSARVSNGHGKIRTVIVGDPEFDPVTKATGNPNWSKGLSYEDCEKILKRAENGDFSPSLFAEGDDNVSNGRTVRPRNEDNSQTEDTKMTTKTKDKAAKVSAKTISKSEAVALFNAMDVKTVSAKTSVKALTVKVNELATLDDAMLKMLDGDPELKGLRDDILSDLSEGRKLVVVEDEGGEAPSAANGEESGNGHGEPAKKKAAKKEKGEKPAKAEKVEKAARTRDGLSAYVREAFVAATSAKSAVKREDLLEDLKKKFPDKEEKRLRHEISAFLCWRGPQAGLTVNGDKDKGYWVSGAKK